MTTVATGGLAPLFGRETKIFDFIDDLLKKTGKIGEYDQKM